MQILKRVPIDVDTSDALLSVAQRELRRPEAQAAIIIRDWLIEHGWLRAESAVPKPSRALTEVQNERAT